MVRDAGLVTELETQAPMTREELEAVDMHRKATGRINGVHGRRHPPATVTRLRPHKDR